MDTTIAAISTALNEAGIGIIRVSGPKAFEIAARVFHPKKEGKDIRKVPTHTIHYGFVYDQEERIDEVLLMLMKGPRTYTGEDTIEIDCHGGVLSMKRVLDTVLKYGASLAEPGEFTKRAFLNGRIDLSQAEAVMDVITSKNDYALKSSMDQLRGSLSSKVKEMREKLLYQMAYLESALDDPEHISLDGYKEGLETVIQGLEEEIKSLLLHSSDGKILREGIKTVILGKPNAGKSSLLNRMLGEERAIVTEIAGTTRDTLEEYINLSGITLHMIDTAGIRTTEDLVEQIGVEKAWKAADEADLILYVLDSSTPLDENDEKILSKIDGNKVIALYNKTDLTPAEEMEELSRRISLPLLPISTKSEEGIDVLTELIRKKFFEGRISMNDEVMITNIRHKKALEDAKDSLSLVMDGIRAGVPEDFLSIDLMNAYESLGRIIGEAVEEDLVNEIFQKFCMGK